jgi:subtilisin family serine protease
MHFLAHRKIRLTVMLAAVTASAFVGGAEGMPRGAHASDRLVVKFKTGVAASDMDRAERAAQVKEISSIRALGAHVMSVAPNHIDAALAALRASGRVAYAEYDGIMHAADTTPNDPWWPNESSAAHVRMPQAWDDSTGSAQVTIAILDTGVDSATPDLQGAFVPGYDFVNNDTDPSDDHGHGTMAAGVAAARGNNAIGIAGYCWSCSIMPVKVMGADGSGLQSTVASGIVWATDHGARVISMSLYGGAYSTLASAVQYAHSKGVVLVAAAGNNGSSGQTYPAAYPEVLGAAGTNPDDTLNTSSNYGSWVKLAAPWCNYATSMRQSDGSYRYAAFCGTSSATPALAGVAALVFSYDPTASNAAVEHALESTGVAVVGSRQVAYGRIDAYQTMIGMGAAAPAGTAPANTGAPPVTGTATEGQTLTASSGSWSGSTPITFAFQWQRCDAAGFACTNVAGATSATYSLTSGDVGSTLRIVVTAANPYGSSTAASTITAAVTAAVAPTPAPSATTTVSFTGSLNKKQSSKSFAVTVGAGQASAVLSFTKASSLSLTIVGSDGTTVATASGPSVVRLAQSLPAATYQFVVAGGGGNSANFTLSVTYAGS